MGGSEIVVSKIMPNFKNNTTNREEDDSDKFGGKTGATK